LRVAYLGPAGTFSEDALEVSGFAPDTFEPRVTETIPAAIEAVAEGFAERALVPVENSIEGSVADVHHLLPSSGLKIIGERFKAIHFQLIFRPGVTLDQGVAGLAHWAGGEAAHDMVDSAWKELRDHGLVTG